MSYEVGKPKSLDDIRLENCIKYPIWEFALDEEDVPGQDETWQRPIISSDVTEDMYNPIITFAVKGTQMYGSGTYDHARGILTGNAIWIDGRWVILTKVPNLLTPAVFVALPSIRGVHSVQFVCDDIQSDTAVRHEFRR